MHIPQQEREAKLLPVVGVIVGLYVLILGGSYFIGNYIF